MSRLFVVISVAILVLALQSQTARAEMSPSTVFVNGKILTVDENFTQVEALAVTGNQISALGTSEEIAALAGDGTKVIDLGGRTLIPGLMQVVYKRARAPYLVHDAIDNRWRTG